MTNEEKKQKIMALFTEAARRHDNVLEEEEVKVVTFLVSVIVDAYALLTEKADA